MQCLVSNMGRCFAGYAEIYLLISDAELRRRIVVNEMK